jgi:hypothetical protein
MAEEAENTGGRRASPWRIAAWGLAAFLVLLPLVAMQFADEVSWTQADFIFAGVLIGGIGLTFELAVRMTRNRAYRAGVGIALAAAFLIIWANIAGGMIGSEGNVFNLLFIGVILVALVGTVAARFRPTGIALAMIVAAVAHGCVAVVGMFTDLRGGLVSLAFAGLWLLSAASFRKAARQQTPAAAALQA